MAASFGQNKSVSRGDVQQLIAAAVLAERERTRPLITECRKALAEELAGWDLDPPLAHVKQAHDSCDDWLRSIRNQRP